MILTGTVVNLAPLLGLLLHLFGGTHVHCASAAKTASPITRLEGPVEHSVGDRGLLTTNPTARSVLQFSGQYWKATHQRNFSGDVMAYVTPWNGKGYDVAKTWRAKFSHISPVWYQLRPASSGGAAFKVTGMHDVDHGWMADLRKPIPGAPSKGARVPLIVPRVNVEVGPQHVLQLLSPAGATDAAAAVAAEVAAAGADGIVLEGWSGWTAMGITSQEAGLAAVVQLLRAIRAAMAHHQAQHLILAVPPAVAAHQGGPVFSRADMAAVRAVVAGFSVMTYDAASPASPGPNAPLPWVRAALEHLVPSTSQGSQPTTSDGSSLLLGLNFYGNVYRGRGEGGTLVGHEFMSMLDAHRPPLEWLPEAAEHVAKVTNPNNSKEPHLVYFPSLASIQARLDLASELGVGIAIWEIGQGLDYFCDLL